MPFGGLQLLASSGQGITGQSEELDELLAKVLGKDIKEGVIQESRILLIVTLLFH